MTKKFLIVLYSIIFLFIGMTSISFALNLAGSGWTDITVFDGLSKYDYPDWHGNQEDNEVELNAGTGQIWDLEAFFYNQTEGLLVIIGGYDFSRPDDEIPGGDIFLSTSSEDYVMDIDYAGGIQQSTIPSFGDTFSSTYSLYNGSFTTIPSTDITESPDYRRKDDSGTSVSTTGSNTVEFHYGIDQTNWGISFEKDSSTSELYNIHHALVVDVSWINESNIDAFSVYNTMQCGNDLLRGAVPEPATLMLLGLGLLGLSAVSRKTLHNL